MSAAEKYTRETITWMHHWTPGLVSLRVTRAAPFRFVAGHFARLGLAVAEPADADPAKAIVWRAYSIVSGTQAPYLEFCSVLVPTGEFTSELARLAPGATILVEKTSYGFLTMERFACQGDLWMLATGTGLAPFISILNEQRHWSEFDNLIVVHSVRSAGELAYRDTLAALAAEAGRRGDKGRLVYVPVVTREAGATPLAARIPELIGDGRLEATVGRVLDPEHSRVLLCGNPEMVSAARALLAPRGFATSRRGQPGTLAIENYW